MEVKSLNQIIEKIYKELTEEEREKAAKAQIKQAIFMILKTMETIQKSLETEKDSTQ